MSNPTGHTNPLDAAYQEMSNRHAHMLLALAKLNRATDRQIIHVRAGEPFNPKWIREAMLNLDDARDLYDATRENVRTREAEFVRSEH